MISIGFPNHLSPPEAFDNCMICLENNLDHPEGDIKNAKIVGRLECNHFFHYFCLQKFLASNLEHKCPACRKDFNNENIKQHKVNQNIKVLQGQFKRVIIFEGESTALIITKKL